MSEEQRKNFIDAYQVHGKAIYRYCYYRVYSPTLAEDCVQETYLNVWNYLNQGKHIRHLKSFLYQVSHNWIVDAARKNGRPGKREESLDDLLLNHEGNLTKKLSYNGQENMEHDLLMRQARDLIQQLPPDYRTVVSMRYLKDLMPREIAQILHVRPNTISVKINRAVKLLRSQILFDGMAQKRFDKKQ